jgi:hypothetical protein
MACEGGVYLGHDLGAFDARRLKQLDRIMRLSLLLMIVLTYLGLGWRNCQIEIGPWAPYVWVAVFFVAVALCFNHIQPNPHLGAVTALIGEAMITPLATIPFTYAATAFGGDEKTSLIASLDRWMGFEWLAYREFITGSPILDQIFFIAYHNFQLQFFAIPLLLLICGRPAQARLTINCFVLGIIAITLGAMIVPTVDAQLWHGSVAVDAQGYTGLNRIDHLLMLRNGSMTTLQLWNMTGIVCFPSFHAVAACLFAGFSTALGPARFSFLGLNALMLAATPLHGGHYLVDVLAGIAIGLGLIAAALAYTRRRPEAEAIASLP